MLPAKQESGTVLISIIRHLSSGKMARCKKPAYITVVHNGVLTLNHFEIQGTIEYIGTPKYELHDKASLLLQGHGSAVSFRNIWIREI
jgi:hypothetical protein